MLTWSQRFNLKASVRSSMWLIPAGFIVLSIALSVFMPWLDRQITADPLYAYSASSAQATLSAIASGMLVFTGFVFSILTFAIQFGAGTYTPRLLRSISTDNTTKVALGTFIATFIYALLLLAEVAPGDSDYVPQFSVLLSVVSVGISILLFLALIVSVTGSIRPGRVVGDVERRGRHQISAAFPEPAQGPATAAVERLDPDAAGLVVANPTHGGGVLQALHVPGVVDLAKELGVAVELLPAVGDFSPTNGPVFRVYGESDDQRAHQFLDWVAFGDERTYRQDPTYPIRILVDIAIRALSPAINDPTTAREALGRIEDLLLLLGTRQLPDGVHRDADGVVRFVYRTPAWEDYLSLAFTEIRACGADAPLVVDQMRDILAGLRGLVPAWRRKAIDKQSWLLEEAVAKANA